MAHCVLQKFCHLFQWIWLIYLLQKCCYIIYTSCKCLNVIVYQAPPEVFPHMSVGWGRLVWIQALLRPSALIPVPSAWTRCGRLNAENVQRYCCRLSKSIWKITGYFISKRRVLTFINSRLHKTYMTVQRQFAWKLHAGEDDEGEFLPEFVKHSVLITS